jgi:hypothetical protein
MSHCVCAQLSRLGEEKIQQCLVSSLSIFVRNVINLLKLLGGFD